MKTFLALLAATVIVVFLFASVVNAVADDEKKDTCEELYGIQSLPEEYDRSEIDTVHPLEWVSGNPRIINRSKSVSLAITGGEPPYAWKVTGTDFTIKTENTNAPNNQLIAGSSACGVASITVTAKDDQKVTAYIRCSRGHWDYLWGSGGCGNPPWNQLIVDCNNRARWVFRVSTRNCGCWCIIDGKNYAPIPAQGWCTEYHHHFGDGCNWNMSDLCGIGCQAWVCP